MKTPIYTGLLQSDLDATGYRIFGLVTPSASNDAATKAYVDAHGGGGGAGLPAGWVSVADHAGAGDARLVKDAAMTSGSPTLTSATAAFTSADIGKSVCVNGVGVSGALLSTTISGFTNSTTVTLAANAGTTASAQYCAFGTDNTVPVQNAIAIATSVVYFPPGNYFFGGYIGAVPANISLIGAPFFGPSGAVMDTSSTYDHSNQRNPMSGGTTFLLTAGSVSGTTPFISITDNCSVTGITFYWPNQLPTAGTPTWYPWAIHMNGGTASSVKYCNFVNAYNGIYIENTLFSLVEEVRGQMLWRGIKCEGNYDVTRLRGVHFNASWTTAGPGAWQLQFGIAFDLGRNDGLILDNCFAFWYGTFVHCYDDAAHNFHGPSAMWGQIRGGGCDWCTKPIWIEQVQAQGLDIDGVLVSNNTTASYQCVIIASSNTGSVRVHNSMMLDWYGLFGAVDGSGEVTVDNCYFIGDSNPGTAPTSFAVTGWTVTGTGNFALRGCTFKTTQTHLSLGASLTRAVATGNLCSDTFVVTNSMAAGTAVIDNNTGGGTVYVGSDFRLVAITGGAKLQARNPGTNTWLDADSWTNP